MRLPMFERMSLPQIIGGLDFRIGRSIAPSFQNYTVSRSYRIKLTVKVSCAGKLYDVELANHDLSILPETLVPWIAETETNQLSSSYEAPDTEQLPRYEEAISQ